MTTRRRRYATYLAPRTARAVIWAVRARIRARRVVWRDGISRSIEFPASGALPVSTTPAVVAVLARTRATCLVRSIVLQHWYGDHGEPVDVVIGVVPPAIGFRAHAWLDRPGETGYEEFTEIHRLRPAAAVGTSVGAPDASAALA